MNIQVGDLFLIKGNKEDITFIVLEKEMGPEFILYKQHYKVHIYYPEGNTKIQHLDVDTIYHFVTKGEFIHYPVKE